MKHFGQYTYWNPPAYYQAMEHDPTQIPTQYPYGGGSWGPYGPWPGFYFGQRTFEQEDAERRAREQAQAMLLRSEISSDPKDKYITPEGRLNPGIAVALQKAQQSMQPRPEDMAKSLQKKIVITLLVSTVIAALLR